MKTVKSAAVETSALTVFW